MKRPDFQSTSPLFSNHLLLAIATAWAAVLCFTLEPLSVGAQALPGYGLIEIETPREISGPLELSVPIAGEPRLLHLEPHSVRAPDFQVITDSGDRIDPPAPATYRGWVEGDPASQASLSLRESGWEGLIEVEGEGYILQPSNPKAAKSDQAFHLLISEAEIPPTTAICQVGEAQRVGEVGDLPRDDAEKQTGMPPAGSVAVAELALDCDYEYFQLNGGTVESVMMAMESLVNTVNRMYERDVQIRHVITTMIVRDTPNDPYNSTDGLTVLDEVQRQWLGPQANVPCDIMHMLTGKNLNGGNAGYAYIGVICQAGSKFGFSKQTNSSFAVRATIMGHELGHNWNADHCNFSGGLNFFQACCDPPVYTMCSSIRGTPREMFCPPVQRIIREHRNSRTCLTFATSLPTPTPTSVPATATPSSTTLPTPSWTPTPAPATPTPSWTPAVPTSTPTVTPTQANDFDFNDDQRVDARDLLFLLGEDLPAQLFDFSLEWQRRQ